MCGRWHVCYGSVLSVIIMCMITGVRFILRALAKSMIPLIFVSIMTLGVMVFFTFFGMELFHDCGLHGGCFANYTDPSGMYIHPVWVLQQICWISLGKQHGNCIYI